MQQIETKKNLGFSQIEPPETPCSSSKCPFHGTLRVRKRLRRATLVSTKMQHSGVVRLSRLVYVPKYKRFKRVTNKISLHIPDCLVVQPGQTIVYAECRPLAKTIAHVALQVEVQR